MAKTSVTVPHLVLGNQLFQRPKGDRGPGKVWIMIEDLSFASRYRYHRLRLLHQFVAMREYARELEAGGGQVIYGKVEDSLGHPESFFERLRLSLRKLKATELSVDEIPDPEFKAALVKWAELERIPLHFLPSPLFLNSSEDFAGYLKRKKKPFMKTYYEESRVRHQVLVDRRGQPTGGQWSFDVENRKKLPKGVQPPEPMKIAKSDFEDDLAQWIEQHAPKHPGLLSKAEHGKGGAHSRLWLPYRRKESLLWMKEFFQRRFHDFGPYEDALTPDSDFVFHSGLSPLINMGLLTPKEVIEGALEYQDRVPIESLEGFIRQILGWREFIKGIHDQFHEPQSTKNFFRHNRKLKPCWYDGTTGLPPLDDAIKKVNRLAYNHHIERLMVIGNVMLLSEVKPQEAHRWFMEMYLDSYEWVMGPNVYGMSQFSDGGIFATKPYISGSNYILKMSSYPKGDWCEIWDGLYWSFIGNHLEYFAKNPRLSMMAKLYEKMDAKKRARLLKLAREFKDRVTQ